MFIKLQGIVSVDVENQSAEAPESKYGIPEVASITELATAEHFKVEPTGVKIVGKPTIDQWERFGQALAVVDGAVHWWVGDWAGYGEKRFGEKYEEAVKKTGFAYGTIANDVYVAKRFDPSRRRENLSFAHHQEVAKLLPKRQDELLDAAEKNGWSAKALRREVKTLGSKELPVSTEDAAHDENEAAVVGSVDEHPEEELAPDTIKLVSAMACARRAISELAQINPTDVNREEAFTMVVDWIEESRSEPEFDAREVSASAANLDALE